VPVWDVVTGPGRILPFRRGTPSRKARKPKTPATIKGAPATSGGGWVGAASRATLWASIGYGAWQTARWLRDPNFDPWGTVADNMREVARREAEINRKAKATRLRVEKEKAARKAAEAAALAGEAAAYEVIGERSPRSAPGSPDRRFIPGTPEYAQETEIQARLARARARAGAGGPPMTPEEQREESLRKGEGRAAAAAAPAAAAAAQKATMRSRAAALLANPLFQVGLLAAATLPMPKFGGGKKPRAPVEEFVAPPLTEFEPMGVAYGELGGAPAFAEELEPETGTRGEECERIDPKRTPGECRQGWFSETPKGLYLKEWSRRPCQ